MSTTKAKSVIGEIRDALREWPRFAATAGVAEDKADAIRRIIAP